MQPRESGGMPKMKGSARRKKKINTPVKDNKILSGGAPAQRGELGARGEGDGENDGGAKVIEMTSELRAGRQRGKTTARTRRERACTCDGQTCAAIRWRRRWFFLLSYPPRG